jgi:predicted ATPase
VKLVSFQVTNYRSINDSGTIQVGKITTLVGRNESGKTNLLLALQSLNPPGGLANLSPIKDFPRHRRLSECSDTTEAVKTTWELDGKEQLKLAAIFPRAQRVTKVTIGRRYKAVRWVKFEELPEVQTGTYLRNVRNIRAAILSAAASLEAAPRMQCEDVVKRFEITISREADPITWATSAGPMLAELRKSIAAAAITLPVKEEKLLSELEEMAAGISTDERQYAEARNWAAGLLPVFIYVDEYPDLDGHHDIAGYLLRKANNQLSSADQSFEKLCKVADLNPAQLEDLLSKNGHEERNQLANRAGAVITSEIRRLWKDRALKIRFNPDAHHLDTFISDPNAVYDVEVNLDERSRGFKWFFSFYITFAADTKGGSSENAILLLDEPGLYLHASSQYDLLRHLAVDFKNQVLYTTHSPFMVPTDDLDSIRTVNIDQDAGTTVTNDPTGDSRTLFPIQAALGFNIAQTLFIGPANLVVEGVTDYWILSSLSEYLRGVNRTSLPIELVITPAGGAQKITYMVALLTSERLNVMVLLDDERAARSSAAELVKQKLIRGDNVVFVTQAFAGTPPPEADIEDLLDPAVYDQLVRESYLSELGGRSIDLNSAVPRIVRRYEEALKVLQIEFHKTRPARLLLNKMAKDPTVVMTAITIDRFERLFLTIGEQLKKHSAREAKPFH